MKPLIVALIPAYNEEKTIAKVILKTRKYVDKIIVCDDGSKDMTRQIAEALGATVVEHEKNRGYGAALANLFEKAREIGADIAITIDADDQHNPDDIPKLVKPILDGKADIVIGSRFLYSKAENIPAYRRLGIKAITALSRRMAYNDITDAQSGFRAYSKKALQLIHPTEADMGASIEILLQAREHNLTIKEVPTTVKYTKESSTHNPIYHGITVVLSIVKHMSIRHPLMFYGIPGALSLVAALAFWIWTFHTFATTRQIVTSIALMAIGATTIGLMLSTTAMILWVLVTLLKENR